MDFFETIMFPFKWLVSIIMVGFHEGLTAIGLPEASGWTWTLSIIGLYRRSEDCDDSMGPVILVSFEIFKNDKNL